jgi:hypothetical protein
VGILGDVGEIEELLCWDGPNFVVDFEFLAYKLDISLVSVMQFEFGFGCAWNFELLLLLFGSIQLELVEMEGLNSEIGLDTFFCSAIKGTTDPAYHFLFLNRAQLLGFRTEKVLQGIMNAPEVVEAPDSEPCAGSHGGEGKEWRSGRPFRGAYKQSRTQLFLPNLAEAARVEVSLSTCQSSLFNKTLSMPSLG